MKKCEYPGCTNEATCRAPKDRKLKSYWNFCKLHAAEYNQNWDFYSGMTAEEIERDWEKRTFGSEIDKTPRKNYKDLINDILSGKAALRSEPEYPADVLRAFRALGVSATKDMKVIKRAYLGLAKKHHPDAGGSEAEKFKQATQAMRVITKFLKEV